MSKSVDSSKQTIALRLSFGEGGLWDLLRAESRSLEAEIWVRIQEGCPRPILSITSSGWLAVQLDPEVQSWLQLSPTRTGPILAGESHIEAAFTVGGVFFAKLPGGSPVEMRGAVLRHKSDYVKTSTAPKVRG
jgi:hypothetical protein